ncbi:MAG: YihY/virulence factor BrkB family protein, partial [Saprospiraceae bacterium]
MFLHFNSFPKVLKKAFKSWWARDPAKESSVISYSAIFSLPGLLVVVVTLAGYFFGAEIVNHQLHSSIAKSMGEDTAVQIEQMILLASRSRDSIWATILGVVTILVGATGVFVQMQKSLNIIWEVKATTKKSGIWTLLKTRLFSFGLILSIGFLLLISLVISSLLTAAGDWIRMHTDSTLNWLF